MKKALLIVLLSLFGLGVVVFVCCPLRYLFDGFPDKAYANMALRADDALKFAKRHRLSTRYCFFVDYSLPSGEPRFFVWDFKKRRVIASSHCMHGPGGGSTAETPQFSNRPGSNCSSLGRFRVTHQGGEKLKRSFRCEGLDRSNSKAFTRGIMIHSARWVDRYRRQRYIPLNANACKGCFTLSSRGKAHVNDIMEKESKNVLLWSYCPE